MHKKKTGDKSETRTPVVSILITTFNRKKLLTRCLSRILSQTFEDFEVIIIDDCSSDGTDQLISTYIDPRIRYFRNNTNVGSIHGDRMHIKRFVHELSRGQYFVYVCDDDFWISTNLLSKQVAYFETYPNAVAVVGGQLSCFIEDNETAPDINESNLHSYLDDQYNALTPNVSFSKAAFPTVFMTSDAYLDHFSRFPAFSNIIGGAILYNKDLFILSGALQSEVGSKWQAGYELCMGPGCYGDVVYLNEPCILSEIRQKNASFNSTQLDHYQDSLVSIIKAFEKPLQDWKGSRRAANLKKYKRRAIENIGSAYIANTLHIKKYRQLVMCTEKNISVPVSAWEILKTRILHGAWFSKKDIVKMLLIALPGWLLCHGTAYYQYFRNNQDLSIKKPVKCSS